MTFARFALVMVFAAFAGAASAAEHTKDPVAEIKKALADGKAVLVDVREQSEWDDGHLKGAILLPLSTLNAGTSDDEITKRVPKGKVVYCHCAAGGRCLKAADALKKLGYDVRPLKPGYRALLREGFEPATK